LPPTVVLDSIRMLSISKIFSFVKPFVQPIFKEWEGTTQRG